MAHWISATIAAFMIVVGLALPTAGVRNLAQAGTPVPGNQSVRTLVTTGIHAWSRNPIYFGVFLLYVGISLIVRNPWILLLTLPLAIAIQFGVVAREEAYLDRRFGEVYRDYNARVRRWL